jgi:hypothetical protein
VFFPVELLIIAGQKSVRYFANDKDKKFTLSRNRSLRQKSQHQKP